MKPKLLFHCQHSLGLGHLVRSLALAGGFARHCRVTLLNGGRLPPGIVVPRGVELIDLPSLGHDDQHRLVSHAPGRSVEEVQRARARLVLEAFHRGRPDVVVVELYPFGRRKFEFELRPLLDAVAAASPRPLLLSSVRDILVGREDGGRHDERAALIADEHLDAVLVHSDPAFARFEESFRRPLAVPVHHTGFVVPPRPTARPPRRPAPRLLVSAGGGIVGEGLLAVAAEASHPLRQRTGLRTTLVAGPFLPDPARRHLTARRGRTLDVVDRVDDLCGEVRASAASLSQAGYNTTLDLVRAGRPAIVVPYAAPGEDEQTRRATRMAELGLLRAVDACELTPDRLVDEVVAALAAPPPSVALDLGGRERSAEIVAELVGARSVARVRHDWLAPVGAAIAATSTPVRWFFRDDDAGWDDDALWVLLDEFEAADVVVDVAAIPVAVGSARGLAERADVGAVRIHQHGYAHVNHAPTGRKCEFGADRPAARQSADVRAGRARLEDVLGRAIDPVFTPPWNRCAEHTADALLGAGHTVLSRDVTAARLDMPGLAEVPVAIDWSARRNGRALPPAVRGRAIAARIEAGGPVGVMLHHAAMDGVERLQLARLLALVAASDACRPATIVELA